MHGKVDLFRPSIETQQVIKIRAAVQVVARASKLKLRNGKSELNMAIVEGESLGLLQGNIREEVAQQDGCGRPAIYRLAKRLRLATPINLLFRKTPTDADVSASCDRRGNP